MWVKGPSVALGYWNRPEETGHVFRANLADTGEGPFLRTGDLGFFDRGELFITGRLKDLIIIRGLNHYPHDIEQTVEKAHAGIRPSCVATFTIEDDESTRLVVVAEVERTARGQVDAIIEAIRREVSREHELIVDCVVLLKSGGIPKTSSGKIQRHACRSALLADTLDIRRALGRRAAREERRDSRQLGAAAIAPRPSRRTACVSARANRVAQSAAKSPAENCRQPSAGSRPGQRNGHWRPWTRAVHGSEWNASNGNGHATSSQSAVSQVEKAEGRDLEEVRRIAKDRAAESDARYRRSAI